MKLGRPKTKDWQSKNFSIDREIVRQLELLAASRNKTQSKIVEELVEKEFRLERER